jgi:acetylornithine deacetylase/succinyl-diaminopimelate desuccinylase-like protein
VGVISGGTSVNTIAQDAYLELDLRSENIETLNWLAAQVVALVQANRRSGVQIEADLIGDRPVGAIASDHPLIQLAINCLNKQGIVPRLSIGSTDANVPLSRGMPAVCIGLTTGGGAHTTDEYIHTQPLAKGLDQLLAIVEGAFQHTD